VNAGGNSIHILERFYQADRSMPTHTEETDIVEINYASRGIRVDGLAQKCSNDCRVSSRLTDDSRAKLVVFAAKYFKALGHRSISNVGKAFGHNARRFTTGVRVYRSNSPWPFHLELRSIGNIPLGLMALKTAANMLFSE
jgi:hypothetical protein